VTLRLHRFYVEGFEHGPYPGLVDPRDSSGHLGPCCSPAFTRETAEEIVADLHEDHCDMTAEWVGPVLAFVWTADYDGVGGTEFVRPDEHGRYRIGGHWPWEYDGPLDIAERHQAALAHSSASTRPTAPARDRAPVSTMAARPGAPGPGR
jgi:hypothetical protein